MKNIQTDGALFQAVQLLKLLPDGKTFADAEPRVGATQIETEFRATLLEFVQSHFDLPQTSSLVVPNQPNLETHIDALWSLLERPAIDPRPDSSMLALPEAYVVPGGRFQEMYYWDTYFSMLGIRIAGRKDLLLSLVKNFASLIERFGYIPNGCRTYYLSRSQPPFFASMLELIELEFGRDAVKPFLPALKLEYQFFTDHRSVQLPNGAFLNRYSDAKNAPREESYLEDVELMQQNPDHFTLGRELRAAAESGWDFSSRWFGKAGGLGSIRTTDFAPIDLNCLLHQLETRLGVWLEDQSYTQAAQTRKNTILESCWDETRGWFFDVEHQTGELSQSWTLAGMFPLYFKIATPQQAARVATNLERHFLRDGGLITTLEHAGQQWDAPNGWGPLQWVACLGLERYGFQDLALEVARRFVTIAEQVWRRTGRLMEKYNVEDTKLEAGGGEYPAQDGFGWTNGVVRAMIERYGLNSRNHG
jgi:alpha,alpha-trehalase